MKKSEKILLTITVIIAVCAIGYIYLIEPNIKSLFGSSTINLRNKKYIEILNRKDEIQKESKRVLSSNYWKGSQQEQLAAFQIYVEKIAKESDVTQVKSILPITSNNNEIIIQLDAECSVSALTKLLLKTSQSDVPIQIKRLQVYSETNDPNVVRIQIEIATVWINTK